MRKYSKNKAKIKNILTNYFTWTFRSNFTAFRFALVHLFDVDSQFVEQRAHNKNKPE